MTQETTNHDGTDQDRVAVATAVRIVFGGRTLRTAEADALDVGSVVPLDIDAEGRRQERERYRLFDLDRTQTTQRLMENHSRDL